MGIRVSTCSQADLLNTYVNSSYDVVKRVYDSISNIDAVSQIVSGDTQISPEDIEILASTVEAIASVAANLDAILGVGGNPTASSATYETLFNAGAAINNPVSNTCTISLDSPFYGFDAAPASLAVFINGVYQAKGTGLAYTLSGMTVILSEQLANNDIVSIVNGNMTIDIVSLDETERMNLRLTVSGNTATDLGKGIAVNVGADSTQLSLAQHGFFYVMDKNQLFVYVNGIYQALGTVLGGYNYSEVSTTSIVLHKALEANDVIDIVKIV